MPDYKRLVKPILSLLSGSSDGVWKAEHTAALNCIADLVYRRLKLGLVDMSRGARIHVDADESDCSAVMVQQDSKGEQHVVAMLGRELTKGEQRGTLFDRLLLCACWAVKRLSHYVLYLPSRVIVLPGMAEATCA